MTRLVSLGRLARMDVRLERAMSLGESPDNDIWLVGRGVASHHARIVPAGEHWQVEAVDDRAAAASRLNGLPITGPTPLTHLDVVTIGEDVELLFLSEPSAPVPVPAAKPADATEFRRSRPVPPPLAGQAPAPPTAPPPAATTTTAITATAPVAKPVLTIRIARVTGPAGTYTLKQGTNKIGRSPQSDICLNNRQISRDHAVIIVTPRDVTIEHRGGLNRTMVNGEPISGPRVIQAGDRLGFVDIEFELQLE